MSEQNEATPLEIARATMGFVNAPVRVKIDGLIHEFVRSFYRDRDGNDEVIHGDFKFHRDLQDEPDVYTVGLPLLNRELVKKEGWIPIEIKWLVRHERYSFEKGNYFMILDLTKEEPHIEIGAKDLLLVEFMEMAPERFGVTIPCPTIADFRYIMRLLKIN